jgi:hypothetical protein
LGLWVVVTKKASSACNYNGKPLALLHLALLSLVRSVVLPAKLSILMALVGEAVLNLLFVWIRSKAKPGTGPGIFFYIFEFLMLLFRYSFQVKNDGY